LSETFILNEVLELERQGVDLRIYSLNAPQEAVRHRVASEVRSPIEYLPFPLHSHALTYAGAHLELFLRHPLRWIGTLLPMLVRLDRDLLERFVQAGLLARLVRRDGVRHVHAGFVHYPGSVAWIVHRITGLTFSLATHAKDWVHSPPALLRKKLSAAEVVFTCTRDNVAGLQRMAEPAGIRNLRSIYHGADLERFRFEACGADDPPLILSVGRLVEKKGFEYLIAACARLRAVGRRFQCRIVAGSRDRWDELSAQVRELGLEEHVVLEGPLENEAVRGWYRRATVFALPCVVAGDGDRDGIPNVLVEAAATGVPIVSTAVSGIPELVRDGDTGLVVPERDAEALASAIARLLDAPELRERLRTRARARVEECFDLRRNAVAIVTELRAVNGAAPARAARAARVPVQQGAA
jgi:glycosyltransferase involved in cell wall biosynthesis